ncbi:hypothetical protein OGAPHI_006606 [Ogataea philodendri]|uniref:ACB domain-containing protein n=1 Tax=Ogataea philodendri TaxID=1378263 RepID=A0A9P8NY57_9ASCO|nr:uncharacterized protein OGAPHI_006606 [Ogataea philodendri]KAH3661199.1 hypothetical protein OGAPHI_006606 [Ogataea philodendri]
MSDSIDRVFVKAIATIRTLSTRSPKSSLPRPPLSNRVKLYGLYKQATEGDVTGLMDRPIGSRPEDEAAKRKWDAWKQEEGVSRTEAKRQYISFLIETMRTHANESVEARELLSELEYLWDQVKDQQLSPTFADLAPEPPFAARAQSPALSLYRLTSSGSNPNIVRPVSRISMASGLQMTEKTHAPTIGQRTISGNGTSEPMTRNYEFVKWQNDINSTLNRLSSDIASLKTIGLSAHLQESPNGHRNRPRKDRSRKPVSARVRQLVVLAIVRLFRVTKGLVKQAAVDLVVVAICLGVLHNLNLVQGWGSGQGLAQSLINSKETIARVLRAFYETFLNQKTKLTTTPGHQIVHGSMVAV